MDVKAPAKAIAPPLPAAQPVATPAVATADSPRPSQPQTPPVGEHPNALPMHKAPAEDDTPEHAPGGTPEQDAVTLPPPPTPKVSKVAHGPTAAVTLTLIAMIALSTLAIYMYTQS